MLGHMLIKGWFCSASPDDCPPPPAPFPHRIVELRPGNVNSQFSLNSKEALGG